MIKITLLNIGIAVLYVLSGKLGLSLAFNNPSATAIWPPTGIALAAILIFGYRVVPAIFLGAFFTNLTTAGTVATSLGIALGNSLEGIVGAYLTQKFANGIHAFDNVSSIFKFTFFAAILSTTVSANIGVLTLILGGLTTWNDFAAVWITWWLGDAGGSLIITPLILVWAINRQVRVGYQRALHFLLLLSIIFLVTRIIFSGVVPYPYLYIPIAVWVAFWFGQRGATLATVVVAVVTIWYTLSGIGPFVRDSLNESLIQLQLFLSTFSLTALIFAATVLAIRRSEGTLASHEQRFQSLIEKSSDGVVLIDATSKIIYSSPSSTRILGYKPDELEGKMGFDLVIPEDRALTMRKLAELVLKPGGVLTVEYRVQQKDKKIIWVEATGTNLLLDPNVNAVVVNFHDITRVKELHHVKDEFISMTSHALRTPMTAVNGLLSMILNGDYGPVNQGLKKPLENIQASAQRQIYLINDLLNISRLQTGRIDFVLTDFVFSKQADEVIKTLLPLVKQKKLTLTMKRDQEVPVQGDVEWTKHVLGNLIGNALKFTDKGGISISYGQDHNFLYIKVIDTGTGIDTSDNKRLFVRFQRLSNTTVEKSGSGLGLYLSRELTRKMGGDVRLEKSVVGEGSTFVLSLPKAKTALAKRVKAELAKATKLQSQKKQDRMELFS